MAELEVLIVRHRASGWVSDIARKDDDAVIEPHFEPESGSVTVYEGRPESPHARGRGRRQRLLPLGGRADRRPPARGRSAQRPRRVRPRAAPRDALAARAHEKLMRAFSTPRYSAAASRGPRGRAGRRSDSADRVTRPAQAAAAISGISPGRRTFRMSRRGSSGSRGCARSSRSPIQRALPARYQRRDWPHGRSREPEGALPRRVCGVGVPPLSGRECWQQGQLPQTLLPTCADGRSYRILAIRRGTEEDVPLVVELRDGGP